MNINLHIERIVLDGMPFESRDRAKLQAAIETEITALLAGDTGMPGLLSGGAVPRVSANEISLKQGDGPAQLGK